jgi:hypothetical protein
LRPAPPSAAAESGDHSRGRNKKEKNKKSCGGSEEKEKDNTTGLRSKMIETAQKENRERAESSFI